MLPRLKMIIAAFYTIGCEFEGEQKALGDAWFVLYPSIVDFVVIYASLLNMVAKIFRRRMNDWIFPITIVTLSAMHLFRQSIAELSFLNLGGRIHALMEAAEFDQLTLIQMLSPDIAFRMNGNVAMVLWFKLLLLSCSILSLLCSTNMAASSKQSQRYTLCCCEIALKIRACNVGGIGRSNDPYLIAGHGQLLSSYELVRLGYVIVGGRCVMTMADWWISRL